MLSNMSRHRKNIKVPKVNHLDESGAPRRKELDLKAYKSCAVADDYSGLTTDQRFLLEFFDGKTEGKRFPRRDDFKPEELIKYLPYISLLDLAVNESGGLKDAKVRLFGTALAHFYGEWTGQ